MSADLREFERRVEREAGLLAGLPPVECSGARLARVRDAVRAEAECVGPARRRAAWARSGWVAAAAAGLLLAVWSQGLPPNGTAPRVGAALTDVERLDAWLDAAEESEERLAYLLDEGWLLAGWQEEAVDEDAVDLLLESFDEAFDTLGTL